MRAFRYGWWGYVKHMIRRYPHLVNEDERRAVELAIQETEELTAGADRLKVVRLVLWKGSHTIAGAAMQIPCSERTAQRYHADFIRAVGKHFRCDTLLIQPDAVDKKASQQGSPLL